MPNYNITGCTIDDAADIARNNMSAFWEDPNWRYNWTHTDLPSVIRQCTIRTPNNLLKDRDLLRHFKAVDPETGNSMGYIRFKLPVRYHKDGQGNPTWPEGQTADVNPTENNEIKARAEAAWWLTENPNDHLDDQLRVIKNRILATKDYLVLDFFAVHPDNQGKGAGLALLNYGIQKAKELGLDIFVMAFVGGFGIYKRMGFKLLDSLVQDATPFGGNDNYAVQFLEFPVN
ncbi:hypothetical protein N0V82_000632 [Gnomoniopsis sp. IMI 355080]|nr:hypothetical protein N0V82_000632 [Gnomoniopsis sp. IMI 355080]